LSFLTLAEILADCQSGGWAVPAFDAINQETILAVLEGAVAERAPVILMLHPVQTAMKYWPGLVALIQVEARCPCVCTWIMLLPLTRFAWRWSWDSRAS
jgi:fructose/tagatose bisphosphate aldolase